MRWSAGIIDMHRLGTPDRVLPANAGTWIACQPTAQNSKAFAKATYMQARSCWRRWTFSSEDKPGSPCSRRHA